MMTGYVRQRCLNDFAQEVEIRDRMLVSSVAAISQKKEHVSGTAMQSKIKQMNTAFFFLFFFFPSAGVSLKLVQSATTRFFPSLAIKLSFTVRRC